jgi:hypothetical protein
MKPNMKYAIAFGSLLFSLSTVAQAARVHVWLAINPFPLIAPAPVVVARPAPVMVPDPYAAPPPDYAQVLATFHQRSERLQRSMRMT